MNKKIVSTNFTKENLKNNVLIVSKKNKNLFMFPVREKDLQGIDLNDINKGINFLEIYDDFIEYLLMNNKIKRDTILRIFIAPFSENEMKHRVLENGTDKFSVIIEEMRKRICDRRKIGLSNENEAEIIKRTDNAIKEIEKAFSNENLYDAILINPCGEGDKSWGTKNTIPTGKAKLVIDTLCDIIRSNM
jgi:hypothetical protein